MIILVLATKNENLGASWPRDFFLKVEHSLNNVVTEMRNTDYAMLN